MSLNSFSDSYRAAGVDVTAGYKAVELMKEHVSKTKIPGVLGGLGGFGGLFELDLNGYSNPVLVSGTDGVGTKLKIAFLMDKHDTIGQDCVAMCVNDIVCSGAKPLFFLDYIALSKNIPEKVAEIVKGVSDGCVAAGCALVGGETAEMPDFYGEEEYDIAGFAVGVVDKSKILSSENVREGDVLVGLASSGIHSNGYSLVRKVLRVSKESVNTYIEELSSTLGEVLLTPTRIYVKSVLPLLDRFRVSGISHITGGGFFENIPRMLPQGLMARIEKNSFERPQIFNLIAKLGNIPERDMYNTFNMGVGMVISIDKNDADGALRLLKNLGEKAHVIGEVIRGSEGVELC